MFVYAAALAVMFACQTGLTGVIQAPPPRPRPPRASKAPKPLGDLIDAVKWYADREEGAAGEPPDFAPGTNARRRTALKKPPTRPLRLLSAMSFRSTRSLAATTPGSAASSRKTYRG